ncbi:unnamed protein product [Brassica oleracea]|uniref:(rape) hypothetical protein n=1 Tax=Brassica napus TaxID=3708 RepID=A0A816IQG9_BRANA|nr:unnamed protein product [Brassica napus]
MNAFGEDLDEDGPPRSLNQPTWTIGITQKITEN